MFASMFGGMGGGTFDARGGGSYDGGWFGGGSFDSSGPSRRRKPAKGEDTIVSFDITLEEAYRGKRVVMNLSRDRVCTVCNGSGGRNGAKEINCGKCEGKGSIITDRHVSGVIWTIVPDTAKSRGETS